MFAFTKMIIDDDDDDDLDYFLRGGGVYIYSCSRPMKKLFTHKGVICDVHSIKRKENS